MSHPNPHHDPENVRSEDSKFAPKAKSKALKRYKTAGTASQAARMRQNALTKKHGSSWWRTK